MSFLYDSASTDTANDNDLNYEFDGQLTPQSGQCLPSSTSGDTTSSQTPHSPETPTLSHESNTGVSQNSVHVDDQSHGVKDIGKDKYSSSIKVDKDNDGDPEEAASDTFTGKEKFFLYPCMTKGFDLKSNPDATGAPWTVVESKSEVARLWTTHASSLSAKSPFSPAKFDEYIKDKTQDDTLLDVLRAGYLEFYGALGTREGASRTNTQGDSPPLVRDALYYRSKWTEMADRAAVAEWWDLMYQTFHPLPEDRLDERVFEIVMVDSKDQIKDQFSEEDYDRWRETIQKLPQRYDEEEYNKDLKKQWKDSTMDEKGNITLDPRLPEETNVSE